jgi:hypothetical protein
MLRLLPAGAFAGWGLHPLESAAFARRTPTADIRKAANPLGASRVAYASLVYLPSPLPRHGDWRYCFAQFAAVVSAFPKIAVRSVWASPF